MYKEAQPPSPFVAEGNQFKVIELCMCESASLKSFTWVFSPAPCLPCKACTKARAGVCLSGARVFLCLWYFGSRQCCCFPVVRWLDSREDYITLEMCPLIHCCLPHSFPFFPPYTASPYLFYLSLLSQTLQMKPFCFILMACFLSHVKTQCGIWYESQIYAAFSECWVWHQLSSNLSTNTVTRENSRLALSKKTL